MDDGYHLFREGIELKDLHRRNQANSSGEKTLNFRDGVGWSTGSRFSLPLDNRHDDGNAREALLPDGDDGLCSDAPSWSHKSPSLTGLPLHPQSGGLDAVASSKMQAYVPPVAVQGDIMANASVLPFVQDAQDSYPYYAREEQKQLLFYGDGPPRPSFRRALMPQRPLGVAVESISLATSSDAIHSGPHSSNKVGMLRGGGPATVLAGPCSHGAMCVQCVRTQELGIIEDMGRFQQVLEPGLHVMCWPCTDVAGRVSLCIQQLDVVCETKTKDDVFVHICVAVQFRVIGEKVFDAYYRLTDPRLQIQSHVFDTIRSSIPRLDLDDVFVSKNSIALAVFEGIRVFMCDYGYEILDALVVDISPDPKVRESMNGINASKRWKEAMPHVAEAEKIEKVKAAEASAEAAHLSGVGVARQRKAIAQGIQSTIGEEDPKDIMDLLLLSQYMDTLVAVGADCATLQHGVQMENCIGREAHDTI